MKNVSVNQLTNGLPVFIRKSKKTPIVTLQVWVRTGSADEKPNEAGVSHFIEHLLFKGTEKYKPGEIAQVVEQAGGELNAYTSFDQTVFYVTVPKKNLSVASDVLSQMFTTPLFDTEEINNEREVVIEEIKMGLDQPMRVGSKMLFGQMFKGYPYQDPVIGTQENISRITDEEIKSYFKERYQTENMCLVCVGDMEDESETLETLNSYFSHVLPPPPDGKKDRTRSLRSLEDSPQILHQESNFEKDYFYLSWPVEGFLDDKSIAYELLALILGQGESSFLFKKLKLEKGLCRSVGASYFAAKEHGIFVIHGVLSSEEKEAFFKELPKTMKEWISISDIKEDLEKAQNIFESEQEYEEESISSQCRTIGDDWLYYNRFGVTEERKNKLLELNAQDLSKSLKDIFSNKAYLSLLSKKPLEKGEDLIADLAALSAEKIQFSSDHEPRRHVKTEKTSHPETYKTWETEKGSEVHFVQNFDTDVVALKSGFLGGELLASDDTQGLVPLFGSMWARETQDLNESEMNYLFDKHCSTVSGFSGKHSSGLSMMTLKSFFDQLTPAVHEVFNQSIFTPEILEREKKSKLYLKQAQKDRPSSIAFKEFNSLIFEDTFYKRDSIGEEEFIKSVDVQMLEEYMKRSLSQKRSYVIVGALEEEKVRDFLNHLEQFSDFSESKDLLENRDFQMKKTGGFKEISSDKAQSHIIMGYPGVTYTDKRKMHLKLISAYLGGQGGRLFIELRDKASLAYSVAPIEQSAYFGGFFGGYIACDPSKKPKAIEMMRDEFKRCAETKLSEQELKWVQNQVMGQELMGLQRNSSIADNILFNTLYGCDPLEYKKTEEMVLSVTADEIQKTMSDILNQSEYLVTVG